MHRGLHLEVSTMPHSHFFVCGGVFVCVCVCTLCGVCVCVCVCVCLCQFIYDGFSIIKTLSLSSDSAGNPHQYCLACYRIPDGFEPTIVSHGNSKTGRPFYPTLPSTMEQIRHNVQSKGPKETLAIVSAAA